MKRLLERVYQDLNEFPSDPVKTAQCVPLLKDPEWMKETLAWLDEFMSLPKTDRDFFDLYHSWHTDVYMENMTDFRVFFVEIRKCIAVALEKEAKRRRPRSTKKKKRK